MSSTLRWTLLTAVAPVLFGTAYLVTQTFLPADYPLYGAVIRALPAGLILLVVARRRPHGSWWWKSVVLGALNFGAFFAFIYMASQLLPSGIAATLMAASPVVMMMLAWPIVSERPRVLGLVGGLLGTLGVCVMLVTGEVSANPLGVLAAVAAMLFATFGMLLTKRWRSAESDSTSTMGVIAATSWQLIAGGLILIPIAVATEGAPPVLTGSELLGFAYLTIVVTAFTFCIWFTGLSHLTAGTVGLLGLLTPVTGVILGIATGEPFGLNQFLGMLLVFVGIVVGQPAISGALRKRRLHPVPISVESGLEDAAAVPQIR